MSHRLLGVQVTVEITVTCRDGAFDVSILYTGYDA
jgi:hypothetical protein